MGSEVCLPLRRLCRVYLLIGSKWCRECYEDFWKSDKSLKKAVGGGGGEGGSRRGKTQTARDGEDKFNRFMRLGD